MEQSRDLPTFPNKRKLIMQPLFCFWKSAKSRIKSNTKGVSRRHSNLQLNLPCIQWKRGDVDLWCTHHHGVRCTLLPLSRLAESSYMGLLLGEGAYLGKFGKAVVCNGKD